MAQGCHQRSFVLTVAESKRLIARGVSQCEVVKAALANASSIAGLLLTTNTLVAEVKEKEEPVADSVS